MEPTRDSILRAMEEFRSLGSKAFLKKYTRGYPPKSQFLRFEGELYPLKALWSASHTPAKHHREFGYRSAGKGFVAIGFTDIVTVSENDAAKHIDTLLSEQAYEGERVTKEIQAIQRSASIVAKAKAFYEPVCMVCEFDFEATYGELGKGYIECHHIDPLHGRDGVNEITEIKDLAVLCSNCHRMIHRRVPCLTIEELKRELALAELL